MEQDGRCLRSAGTGRCLEIVAWRFCRQSEHIEVVHIEVVESHEDGESKKGPQLIDSNWTPLLVRLLSHDKLGVLVALTYYCFL